MIGISSRASVVLNEIHYHPDSELVAEEFVELANPGTNDVSLAGWRLSGGINFSFPAASLLPAGGFLVRLRQPVQLRRTASVRDQLRARTLLDWPPLQRLRHPRPARCPRDQTG